MRFSLEESEINSRMLTPGITTLCKFLDFLVLGTAAKGLELPLSIRRNTLSNMTIRQWVFGSEHFQRVTGGFTPSSYVLAENPLVKEVLGSARMKCHFAQQLTPDFQQPTAQENPTPLSYGKS